MAPSAVSALADLDAPLAAHAFTGSEEPRPTRTTPPSGREDCPNCGARLHGRYCADCGQLDQPLRMPVHRFLVQSFTEFFGVDGRVWQTLRLLLFKPGALTVAYIQGQRRRYLRPLRVYLSSTLLFFFLLSLLDPVGRLEGVLVSRDDFADSLMTAGAYVAYLDEQLAEDEAGAAEQQALVDSLQARLDAERAAFRADSLAGRFANPDSLEAAQNAVEDLADEHQDESDDLADRLSSRGLQRLVWQREQAAAYPPDSTIRPGDLVAAAEIVISDGDNDLDVDMGIAGGWVQRGRAYQRLKSARTTDARVSAGIDVARTAIAKVPIVMFLMLPVFAFLLKLIYVRRGWYYSEHLVFGLHTHALAFLVFSVVTLLSVLGAGAGWIGVLSTVCLVAIPVYFVLAQKRVYRQGWGKTLFKALLLGSLYSFVLLGVGLVLTVLLAFVSG